MEDKREHRNSVMMRLSARVEEIYNSEDYPREDGTFRSSQLTAIAEWLADEIHTIKTDLFVIKAMVAKKSDNAPD